jgi:hypothetical protein
LRKSLIALTPTGWLMGHVKRFHEAQARRIDEDAGVAPLKTQKRRG